MSMPSRLIFVALASISLAGCKSAGDIVVEEGVGITAVRSQCPAVGIADYTGDITLFRNSGARDAGNIDVVASLTNLRSQCNSKGSQVEAAVKFDVEARRTDTRGERDVTLPAFVTVVRGDSSVVAKHIALVSLHFAEGQERAQGQGQGAVTIDKAAATLAPKIRERITRKRAAGEADAAIDPLADPEVRAAVSRATFEVLAGFQLDEKQLGYNATR